MFCKGSQLIRGKGEWCIDGGWGGGGEREIRRRDVRFNSESGSSRVREKASLFCFPFSSYFEFSKKARDRHSFSFC